MVAGMHRHLRSLRRMQHDGGWIGHLLAEAENERLVIRQYIFLLLMRPSSMHLLTWMKIAKPSLIERGLVVSIQVNSMNDHILMLMMK